MAAKARILLLCSAVLCLPAFANVPKAWLLNEKPHQGLAAANALSAPGIAGCLCDEGGSSRSTCKENEIESDALGRVTLASQKPAGVALPYSFEFLFNADGTPATLRYPSTRLVAWEYDPAGRAKKVGLNSVGAGEYAADLSYAPHGALAAAQWGNGVTEAWTYNNRLQALTMQASKGGLLLGLTYGYGTTNNNGNVLTQKIEAGSQKTYLQSYLYDDVNRLTQVNESTSAGTGNPWWMSFGYGRYGNRWVSGMTPQITLSPATPIASNQYDESKNRLIKQNNGQNLPSNAHDEAGNLQNHPDLGAMLFDGQNRLVRHTAGGAVVNFLYDAEGRRVKKTSINGTVHYLYGPSGQLLAEDGGAAWPGAPARRFLTIDALGSTRMVTDSNGVVKERRDYHPFGEEIQASSVFGNRQELTDGGVTTYNEAPLVTQRFTGKERDAETGLDYFGARYFSWAQGRFTSVDPTLESAKPANPQSWNRYTYALNNPLRYVDPDGRIPVETILDLASLGQSLWELGRNPSWAAAGYAAWDLGAAVLPYVPGSWIGRVAKYGHQGLEAAGVLTHLDRFEGLVNNQYIKQGVALLGQGDDSVRQVLGLSSADKAADFLGVTQSGKHIIGEAKGSDLASAVAQLGNTAKALTNKLGDVKFSAEVVLRKGQKIDPNFRVSGTQLERFNVKTQKWELQTAQGQAINVRYLDE